jgi:hypothetical protein
MLAIGRALMNTASRVDADRGSAWSPTVPSVQAADRTDQGGRGLHCRNPRLGSAHRDVDPSHSDYRRRADTLNLAQHRRSRQCDIALSTFQLEGHWDKSSPRRRRRSPRSTRASAGRNEGGFSRFRFRRRLFVSAASDEQFWHRLCGPSQASSPSWNAPRYMRERLVDSRSASPIFVDIDRASCRGRYRDGASACGRECHPQGRQCIPVGPIS